MKKISVLALVFCAFASAVGAQAAAQCGPHKMLTEALGKQFKESRRAIGISGSAAVVELYVSPQGSWTMVSTNSRGLACVIATGEAWQAEAKAIAGISA